MVNINKQNQYMCHQQNGFFRSCAECKIFYSTQSHLGKQSCRPSINVVSTLFKSSLRSSFLASLISLRCTFDLFYAFRNTIELDFDV